MDICRFSIVLLLTHFLLTDAAENEQECSRFLYDDQLLGKMLKVESKIERLDTELQKFQEVVLSVLEHRRIEMQRSFDTQDKKLAELSKENSKPKDQIVNVTAVTTNTPTVVFNAYTTASGSYTVNQIIVFPEVLLNAGDGYNRATGYFTAPVPGLYHFIAHVCNRRSTGMAISIFHGASRVATSTVHENTVEGCVSVSGVAIMKVGEKACVKSMWSGSKLFSDHLRRPSFIGILLHKLKE